MTEGKVRGLVPIRLILVIAIGAMILYLGVGFVRQVSASHQQREELRRIEREIAAAHQKDAWLEERLRYVHSAAAVEEWARENGWAKEDEVSVVVVAPSIEPAPDAMRVRELETRPSSTREVWWDWFFGER